MVDTQTNGMNDQEIIEGIQAKIILATEAKNTELQNQLTDELIEARANAVRKKVIEDLQAELENRDLLRRRAEKITEKCKAQKQAIDALLKTRDEILPPLKEALDKAKLLPAMEEMTWHYRNAEQLAGRRLPEGYLSAKLLAATLEVKGGVRSAHNLPAEALYFLNSAYGLLAALVRVDSPIPTREATLFEIIEEPPKKKKS